MGWLYTSDYQGPPSEYLKRQHGEKFSAAVVETRTSYTAVWWLLRFTQETAAPDTGLWECLTRDYVPNERGEIFYISLDLIRHVPRATDGYTFGYKSMDESAGPHEICPASLLKLASPLRDNTLGYARNFRERCKAYHDKPKVKDGTRIRFKTPLRFTNGEEIAELIAVKKGNKLRFRKPVDGAYPAYRLSKSALEDAEIVT